MVFDCFMIFTEVKVIMRKHSSAPEPDGLGMVEPTAQYNLWGKLFRGKAFLQVLLGLKKM